MSYLVPLVRNFNEGYFRNSVEIELKNQKSIPIPYRAFANSLEKVVYISSDETEENLSEMTLKQYSEAKKYGIDPLRQRLYATPVNRSRNMLATDIAERKLLSIMEDELLGVQNNYDYIIKEDNDLSRFLWKRYEGEI